MWLLASIIGCLLVVNQISTSSTRGHLPQHQFGYTVNVEETGDYKTHHEVNDGEEVRGVYSVGEPNGDLRVVNYTADRLNGFRALVSVHPGASPVKQHIENLATNNHNTSQDNSTRLKEDLKSAILNSSTLFDILPGLDKHVPKIEYIVEDDYEDKDAIPVYLKNILNSSDKPQVIPVKVQEDPYDKSPELTESDSGASLDIYTNVKSGNTSTAPDLQHGLKENVSFSHTAMSGKVITNTQTTSHYRLQPTSSTSPPLSSSNQMKANFGQIIPVKQPSPTNEQRTISTTEKPVSEDVITTVKNQTLQQHSTKSETEDFVPTVENKIKDGVFNLNVNELAKVKETNSGTLTQRVSGPDDKIILTALMLPSPPIIKFTCMPDITDDSGIKITPIPPNISPDISQYPARNAPTSSQHNLLDPKNTIRTPTMTSTYPQYQLKNNRLYPLGGIHFTSQDGQVKFASMTNPYMYLSEDTVTHNPTMTGGSRVDQQKTTHSVPTVAITPPSSKTYQNLGKNGNPSYHSAPRQSPLYPIPYPWIYHPARPSHSYHPRHLPVFVLPMSHNVNFARTFDPQSFDKHNN